MERVQVREVQCKTVLHRTERGFGSGYAANFYKGCLHGCVYCYAPSLLHDDRRWGIYVDAKINAPAIVAEEVRRLERGVVFLCSATDPYQPVEARYGITRSILKTLSNNRFPVTILTRSPLVLRDLDILRRFEWVRVGMSISSVPSRDYEPGVPSLERRIETLRSLSRAGVKTWVSMAPIIPGLVLTDIEKLVATLKEVGVGTVAVGLLRLDWYRRSREMFEKAIGTGSSGVMSGADETVARVRECVRRSGMEVGKFFDWEPSAENHTLDSFGGATPG